MRVGEAGNAISKLCTSQATKKVLVDGSPELMGAHLDGRKKKWMKHRNLTYSDIFKLKNVYMYKINELEERELSAQIATKLFVARQVIQSENCALAR